MPQLTVEQSFQTAVQHHQAGRLQQAENLLEQTLAMQPNHAAALHLLGAIAFQTGRHDRAVNLIRQAIALQPDWPEAHSNLGNALRVMGQLDEAIAACRHAVVLKPGYAEAHYNLGNALRDNGQPHEAAAAYRQAIDCYERAGNRGPKSARPWDARGWALCCLGRFEEAADCFRRALDLNPNLGTAHQHLADIGQHLARPTDIDRMTSLTTDESLPAEDRARMGFALGNVLDDADRFDEAFAAYARANSLFLALRTAAGVRFDPQALARDVEQLIREYTPSRFAQIGRVGSPSEAPVFIVGMPRSGTSLVEQIAASHPLVFGAGEIKDIRRLADALAGWGRPGGPQHLDTIAAAKLADAHVAHLTAISGGAARVIDKMLDNTFALALIAVLFPASRVIFCHRDARDNCLSCHFRFLFPGSVFARDLTTCAQQWVQTDRLMKHWRTVLPLRMLDIQYEELVADPDGQSRRLIDFLGLPWDPRCLNFHLTRRPVLTFSNWQVRQPVYGKSVGRWRHYQRHLGPMLAALGNAGTAGAARP